MPPSNKELHFLGQQYSLNFVTSYEPATGWLDYHNPTSHPVKHEITRLHQCQAVEPVKMDWSVCSNYIII